VKSISALMVFRAPACSLFASLFAAFEGSELCIPGFGKKDRADSELVASGAIKYEYWWFTKPTPQFAWTGLVLVYYCFQKNLISFRFLCSEQRSQGSD